MLWLFFLSVHSYFVFVYFCVINIIKIVFPATTSEVEAAEASFVAKFILLLQFCKMGRVIFCLCSKKESIFCYCGWVGEGESEYYSELQWKLCLCPCLYFSGTLWEKISFYKNLIIKVGCLEVKIQAQKLPFTYNSYSVFL